MASPPLLCISASFGRAKLISQIVASGTDAFPEVHLASTNAAEELAVAKASGKPIVLIILGPMGHDGVEFLCDDCDQPAEQRRVKWIHSVSAGIDWYRLESLQDNIKGIPFTTGKGGYSYFLALHVLYSVLYFNRETARLQDNRAQKQWEPFDMMEPRGNKVGIIGYGDIGQATAKMLQPLQMHVTGVRRTEGTANGEVDAYGVTVVAGDAERARVISESDYVVNILPGTPATNGLFNKTVFASMKRNAVYINVGRGSTQNEADLAEALETGVIHGASLDVFQVEPLPPDSPLWGLGNDKILITSHNACITSGSFRETVSLFVTYSKSFLETGSVSGYQPNLSLGY